MAFFNFNAKLKIKWHYDNATKITNATLNAKLKINLMASTHKNKNLSATLPGNGARKVLDNPQEQGITVAALNVEEGYRSTGGRRKS